MKHYNDIIEFLRLKGPGYRVTSQSDDTEEILQFIRDLYNFQDLSDFAYALIDDDDDDSDDSDDDIDDEDDMEDNFDELDDFDHFDIDDDFDVDIDDAIDIRNRTKGKKLKKLASLYTPISIPQLPSELDLEIAKIRPFQDRTIKDAAIRCLQAYIEKIQNKKNSNGNTPNNSKQRKHKHHQPPTLSQHHIEVFQQLHVLQPTSTTTSTM
jgi:hypothetical protein